MRCALAAVGRTYAAETTDAAADETLAVYEAECACARGWTGTLMQAATITLLPDVTRDA